MAASTLGTRSSYRVPAHRRSRSTGASGVLALLVILGLAVAVRLTLLVRAGWLLEGDDALSALMGLAVREGDRPIMLKNQVYAGAWEPYAMAVSYTLFGVSRVAAKLPALLGSLALVGTTWLLARDVAGPRAARFAALFAALAPIYVLVMTLKPWAPYTEVMIFGQLALLAATRLAFRGRGAAGLLPGLGCGLAGGFAFYLHPLAVWYLVPCVLLVLLCVRGRRLAEAALGGALGFAVGALPLWVYHLQTGGATLRYVLAGSRGQTVDRGQVLSAWLTADLPRGTGLWAPWSRTPELLSAGLAVILGLAVVWAVVARPAPRLRPLDGVLLLLATIPVVFALSGFGGPALNPYGFDATGRYTPPIWSALAIVLGGFMAWLWRWRRTVAAPLAAFVVGALAWQWQAVDAVQAFQSPYWSKLPVDSRPLLDALRADGVDAVWLNHWAGLPVMFDARAAGQPLVAYDWYDVQAGGIDRYPEYLARVRAAAKPAFVLVTDEPHPELESRLDALGVAYAAQRAGPYVVVIPTSRHVDPAEVTPALDYRY
jgi:Dolichyl-phosphate-mannose-protein mannosyltransferase